VAIVLAAARFLLTLVAALILARYAFELATPMVADAAEAFGITTAKAWRLIALGSVLLVLVNWQPRRSYGKGDRRR
jgi:hypothetical protein